MGFNRPCTADVVAPRERGRPARTPGGNAWHSLGHRWGVDPHLDQPAGNSGDDPVRAGMSRIKPAVSFGIWHRCPVHQAVTPPTGSTAHGDACKCLARHPPPPLGSTAQRPGRYYCRRAACKAARKLSDAGGTPALPGAITPPLEGEPQKPSRKAKADVVGEPGRRRGIDIFYEHRCTGCTG